MKNQVHPLAAVLIVAVALAAVWYCYTTVFSGKREAVGLTPETAAIMAGKSMRPGTTPPPPAKTPAGDHAKQPATTK